MRVRVEVTRRPEIADPEGTTIKRALHDLGHQAVDDVRADKVFHLEVAGEDATAIREQVNEMCQQLLANPVLEDFRITVEAEDGGRAIKTVEAEDGGRAIKTVE